LPAIRLVQARMGPKSSAGTRQAAGCQRLLM
jgi:hypothetical protein